VRFVCAELDFDVMSGCGVWVGVVYVVVYVVFVD